MAMAVPRCVVTQQPDVVDATVTESWASFLIELNVRDHVLDCLWGGHCPLQRGPRRERLTIGRSLLLGNSFLSFPQLSMSLASLGIPGRFHLPLVRDIWFYAALLVNDTFDGICNASRHVIPVAVEIFLCHEHDEVQAIEVDGEEVEDEDIVILGEMLNSSSLDDGIDREEEDVEDEDGNIMDEILHSSFNDAIDHQLGVQPASKASIEAMKKLRFEGGATHFANNTECVICSEEFEMGAGVILMPCLQRSHACPLCRYEMPRAMPSL